MAEESRGNAGLRFLLVVGGFLFVLYPGIMAVLSVLITTSLPGAGFFSWSAFSVTTVDLPRTLLLMSVLALGLGAWFISRNGSVQRLWKFVIALVVLYIGLGFGVGVIAGMLSIVGI